jgi:hypothetical protein
MNVLAGNKSSLRFIFLSHIFFAQGLTKFKLSNCLYPIFNVP